MKKRDFNWCFNHENLFRYWLYYISFYHSLKNPHKRLDNATIFSLWQKAKEYALEFANSKDPVLYFRIRYYDMFPNWQKNTITLLEFLYSMLKSSKNKNLETVAEFGDKAFKVFLPENRKDVNPIDKSDTKSFNGIIHPMLMAGQLESDYDYSLPDGGLTKADETKTDETITDETITETDETKTKTDETITKTKTEEESVDVILPKYNALNDVDFKSAMQKAIEKGWIEEIEDGRYKWVGPTRIGTKKIKGDYNAALAYFIAKALKIKMELKPDPDKNLTNDSYKDINNKFPENYDIKEVFGVDIQSDQLVNALRAKNIQKWREVIDKFFDENKHNI